MKLSCRSWKRLFVPMKKLVLQTNKSLCFCRGRLYRPKELETFVTLHTPKSFDELIESFEEYEESTRRFSPSAEQVRQRVGQNVCKAEFDTPYARMTPSGVEVVDSKIDEISSRLSELTLLMRRSQVLDARQQARNSNVSGGSCDRRITAGSVCFYCHHSGHTEKER